MLDQAVHTPPRVERRRPRRRRTDVNPLAAGVLIAATFAILFHIMPGGDAVQSIRVVLTGTAVVTSAVLLALVLLELCGRTRSGHTPTSHPGRRSGDRRES